VSEQIKVLIVDDHPVFRQGLRDVLETDPHLNIIGEAADGEVALEIVPEINPDVILMDINLPTMNGLQVTRKIKGQFPQIKVIMITGYDDAEQVFHALRAGASAYCPKDITPEALIGIINIVQDGNYVVGEKTMNHDEVLEWVEQKIGRFAGPLISDTEEMFVPLSPREMEILEHVTRGLSNKEIAYKLGISHQTVKNHMTAILRKLRVDDRTQAAVYALRHGWVRLEGSRGEQKNKEALTNGRPKQQWRAIFSVIR
jgi:DNA-binding NarL/FixJ family response regulator